MRANTDKPYRGLAMEGPIATWYARNAARDIAEYRRAAMRIAGALPLGADVLDVATGPGHLAIELTKLRTRLGTPNRVTGVDISRSFIRIAAENAREAEIDVAFKPGKRPPSRSPTSPSMRLSAGPPSRTSPTRSRRSTKCSACCGRAGSA